MRKIVLAAVSWVIFAATIAIGTVEAANPNEVTWVAGEHGGIQDIAGGYGNLWKARGEIEVKTLSEPGVYKPCHKHQVYYSGGSPGASNWDCTFGFDGYHWDLYPFATGYGTCSSAWTWHRTLEAGTGIHNWIYSPFNNVSPCN